MKYVAKAGFLQTDLVDSPCKLTITVNMRNNLIECFQNMFIVGKTIQITHFVIIKKGMYEQGGVKCCIVL